MKMETRYFIASLCFFAASIMSSVACVASIVNRISVPDSSEPSEE